MKKTQIEQGSDPLYDLRSDIYRKLKAPEQSGPSPWAVLKKKYDAGELKSPVGALLALHEAAGEAQDVADDSELSTNQWQDLLEGISKRRG